MVGIVLIYPRLKKVHVGPPCIRVKTFSISAIYIRAKKVDIDLIYTRI